MDASFSHKIIQYYPNIKSYNSLIYVIFEYSLVIHNYRTVML